MLELAAYLENKTPIPVEEVHKYTNYLLFKTKHLGPLHDERKDKEETKKFVQVLMDLARYENNKLSSAAIQVC